MTTRLIGLFVVSVALGILGVVAVARTAAAQSGTDTPVTKSTPGADAMTSQAQRHTACMVYTRGLGLSCDYWTDPHCLDGKAIPPECALPK
jgi:hypothetical protein